jgi:hypothetical protein
MRQENGIVQLHAAGPGCDCRVQGCEYVLVNCSTCVQQTLERQRGGQENGIAVGSGSNLRDCRHRSEG